MMETCKTRTGEDPLKDHLKDLPKIYTSYYSSPVLRKAVAEGKVVPISISLYPPKGWKEKGKLWYYPLCPSEEIFREVKSTGNQQEYVRQLLEQLDKLNPEHVMSDLMEMSGGKSVCLLCYERPVPVVNGIFCHRTVVGQWLSSNLGIVVPELTEKHVQDLTGQDNDETSLF